MLVSFGIIFIMGILFKKGFEKINLPGLIGLIITGIIIGPYSLNLLDTSLLNISETLREVALIIIIFRAGLNLDLKKLLQNKVSVILLSFLPATFEIGAVMLLGPLLLNLSLLDSAILGCIVGAVSPAVIVPSMIKIIQEKYGTEKGIPQMIMSAASVDDIYVITIFLALINMKQGNQGFDLMVMFSLLLTIILGIVFGVLAGKLFNLVVDKLKLSKEYLILVVISILFLINGLEDLIKDYIGFSSLLAIISFGVVIKHKDIFENTFKSLWSVFEILLFVLIGSQLNVAYVVSYGILPLILIVGSLIIRSLGVFTALLKSGFNKKEKLFTVFSFMPKATVQAAIGPIPLALGFASGEVILTVAILAILFTAPLGYFLINKSYKKLLSEEI